MTNPLSSTSSKPLEVEVEKTGCWLFRKKKRIQNQKESDTDDKIKRSHAVWNLHDPNLKKEDLIF